MSLVCEFRAHYANSDTNRLKLQWFHDNPEVTNSTRHTIYTGSPPGRSELFIRNVSHVDDGNYTCKAMLNGTDEDVNRVIALSVISKCSMSCHTVSDNSLCTGQWSYLCMSCVCVCLCVCVHACTD